MTRQNYTIDELKDMLLAQIDQVAHTYAPPAAGAYTDKGQYFTLNPGRVDRSVGSFCIRLTGPKAGRWNDYATGDHGDVLDLIRLSLGLTDMADAIREARNYLGLQSISPEDRRRREAAAAEAKRRRMEAEQRARDLEERRRRQAHAIWLSAEERIAGTPVEAYLRDRRGIDLARLGRQPRAIRYLAQCYCKSEYTDETTGEVIREFEGRLPAMVSLICDGRGEPQSLHRTYLAIGRDGRWDKAPIRKPKLALGPFAGGAIRLSSGVGPRGGKGMPLHAAPEGSRVYIAEGIETGLSMLMLRPDARVLAAVSITNMGQVVLPRTVTEVVLIGDQDTAAQAQGALQAAVATHAAKGRQVRLWQSGVPGMDLNDVLRQALAAELSEDEQPS